MPLDRYMFGLVRWWYILVLLIVVGLVGSLIIVSATRTYTAATTVAVSEPTITKPNSNQAQLTFDAIVKSDTVARSVIKSQHLSISPTSMQGKVTVTLGRSLVAQTASPLYTVQVRDADSNRAIALDNAVVAEAQRVFLQLNTVDPTQVNAAFQPQEQQVQDHLTQAQNALLQFENQNKAWSLTDQIAAQLALVNGLRQSMVTTSLGVLPATPGQQDPAVRAQLATAQKELDRLHSLAPAYERLALNVAVATAAVNQFAGQANDLALTNRTAMQTALQGEADARARLTNAQNALTAFQTQNNVLDLSSQMNALISLTSSLQQQSLKSSLTGAALQSAITTENSRLQTMLKLLPQYSVLGSAVAQYQGQLGQLESTRISTLVSGGVSPAVEVKVLDPGAIQPNRLTGFVLSALGPLVGLIVGLVVIYVLAYFDRRPETVEDVQLLTGVPVLARIPGAF